MAKIEAGVADLTDLGGSKRDKPHVADTRRAQERQAVFTKEADERIWHKYEKGFCTIPRTLPLVCTLIRELSKGADAARVYLDFWGRQHEDGFIEVVDETEFAAACGYEGAHRGVRYWRTGVKELERLGFIEVKSRNQRKFGYVLLIHHADAIAKLAAKKHSPIPSWWIEIYERRLREIGARKRAVA